MTPSAAARRFDVRLRLYTLVYRAARSVDAVDLVTVSALGLLLAGLTLPAAGLAVVGALLIPITPIGTAIRLLIRGR